MASFNRVILVGNLTRDLELRYIPSGTAVTDIGLAVNDRRKNASGEWVEETTFVDVTLWGRTAEVASEYLSKGSPVLIEGRLKLDTLGEGRPEAFQAEGDRRADADARARAVVVVADGGGGGGGRVDRRRGRIRSTARKRRRPATMRPSTSRPTTISRFDDVAVRDA